MNFIKNLFSSIKKTKRDHNNESDVKFNEFGMPYVEISGEAENAEDWLDDAVGLFQINDYKNALKAVNIAIQMNSNYADAYHIRGSIKNAMGLKFEACQDWKKCVELGGDAQDLIDKNC